MNKIKAILFDKNTKKGSFNTYGLGKIDYIKSLIIREALNGEYEAELIVDMRCSRVKDFKKWNIISINGQLFRIFSYFSDEVNEEVKVVCNHIFYDLYNSFIIDNRAENTDVLSAMKICLNADFNYFIPSSDIADKNTLYFVKNNTVQSLFEIIKRWDKGELVRDNFNFAINKSKGKDNGVTFTYKKIDNISVTEETDGVVTRLYPSGKEGITLKENYIIIPQWNSENYPPFHLTREIKFDNAENEGDLRVLATEEAKRIGESRVNIKIDLSDLLNTDIYNEVPALKKVDVGDIITVKHPKYRYKLKVIKKEEELVSGDVKLELGQPLDNFFEKVDNSYGKVELPSLELFIDGMFYYSNGVPISISNKVDEPVADITYGVDAYCNLLCFVNLFYNARAEGKVKVKLFRDNELQPFVPTVNLLKGDNHISFSYPLIANTTNGGHFLAVKLDVEGDVIFDTGNIQVILKGQGLAGGGAEPPHAEVIEKYDFEPIINKPLDGRDGVRVSKRSDIKRSVIDRYNLGDLKVNDLSKYSNVFVYVKHFEYNFNIDNIDILVSEGSEIIDNKIVCVGMSSKVVTRELSLDFPYLEYVRNIQVDNEILNGGEIRMALSLDGVSWKVHNENGWIDINLGDGLEVLGMSLDYVNNLSEIELEKVSRGAKAIKLAFFMKKESELSSLSISKILLQYKVR